MKAKALIPFKSHCRFRCYLSSTCYCELEWLWALPHHVCLQPGTVSAGRAQCGCAHPLDQCWFLHSHRAKAGICTSSPILNATSAKEHPMQAFSCQSSEITQPAVCACRCYCWQRMHEQAEQTEELGRTWAFDGSAILEHLKLVRKLTCNRFYVCH